MYLDLKVWCLVLMRQNWLPTCSGKAMRSSIYIYKYLCQTVLSVLKFDFYVLSVLYFSVHRAYDFDIQRVSLQFKDVKF